MKQKQIALLLALAMVVLTTGAFAPAAQVLGLILTVNSTSDAGDRDLGDNRCDFSAAPGDQCSLRAAIEELNAYGDSATPHRIEFDIPGTGPFYITPYFELPGISVPLVIAGDTQPGATCPTVSSPANLQIVLYGLYAGAANGLTLFYDDDSIIQGLSIVRFEHFGVELWGNNNVILRCNHIGVDASGFVGMGNGWAGVFANGDNNLIGGDSIADRNVISHNGQGVFLDAGSDFTVVAGNYIGTAADGITPLGNSFRGVKLFGDDNVIGGFDVNERNVIAANGFDGIQVFDAGDPALGNTILNNYIGVDKNGNPLGNGRNGILLENVSSTTVGNATAPNLIAHNDENGIRVGEDAEENALRVNIIRDNGLLGIDLQGPGEGSGEVTLNDSFDSDSGANGLQNHPDLELGGSERPCPRHAGWLRR